MFIILKGGGGFKGGKLEGAEIKLTHTLDGVNDNKV